MNIPKRIAKEAIWYVLNIMAFSGIAIMIVVWIAVS